MCDTVQLVPIRFLTGGWVMADWSGRWTQQWAAEGIYILRPAFETVLRLVTQFAHGWNLPCCQCTETCPDVSSMWYDKYILFCNSAPWKNTLTKWFNLYEYIWSMSFIAAQSPITRQFVPANNNKNKKNLHITSPLWEEQLDAGSSSQRSSDAESWRHHDTVYGF